MEVHDGLVVLVGSHELYLERVGFELLLEVHGHVAPDAIRVARVPSAQDSDEVANREVLRVVDHGHPDLYVGELCEWDVDEIDRAEASHFFWNKESLGWGK